MSIFLINYLEVRIFLRYLVVSAIALGVDYLTYLMLLMLDMFSLQVAATIGYLFGLVVVYLLVSKNVFQYGWLKNKPSWQMSLFLISGLLGLVTTYVMVLMSTSFLGLGPYYAKLVAVIVSFCVVYLFRRYVVFRSHSAENLN